ncbi:hypothetical protein BIFDEN_01532 [Bifidobacterium dentium ATCC 27678]|nr:hypothetical protein BIFDEN_01532 [Bifidobacterium dentium ATCC 27678]
MISIHALREESDITSPHHPPAQCISIHALREESDPVNIYWFVIVLISIHALREESDVCVDSGIGQVCYFNPRSP